MLKPRAITPDDVLQRVLRAAGRPAVIVALRVSRQWRRVALYILETVRAVNVPTLFRDVPNHEVTHARILRTILTIPMLTSLSFRGWPTSSSLTGVASALMQSLSSTTLTDIDLSGLEFDAQDLTQLLNHCPALVTIRMVGCSCVTDSVVQRLLSSRRAAIKDADVPPYDTIDVSECPISKDGLVYLLNCPFVDNVVATKGTCRGVVVASRVHAKALNLSASKSSFFVGLTVSFGALLSLNLSQCHSLTSVSLVPLVASGPPLALQHLNLAGASHLTDVIFRTPGPAEPEDIDAQPWCSPIPNIETLSFFGARALSPDFFRIRLGLSSPTCVMPCLEKLDLNGCLGLDKLVLNSYRCLTSVDCSGALILDHLEIRDCERLTELSVGGKRAPLRLVDLEIPLACNVRGRRDVWSWETNADLIRVSWA
jgi:hypothetical protein